MAIGQQSSFGVIKGVGVSIIAAALAGLAACGEGPASSTDGAASAATAPAAAPAAGPAASQNSDEMVAKLQTEIATPGVKWIFAEGVAVDFGSDPAPLAGFKTLAVAADASAGKHRLGQQRDLPAGKKTYILLAWVKNAPGVDAMIEVAGGALKDGKFASYGVSYFDLTTDTVAQNAVVTAETQLPKAGITTENGWKKLSGEIALDNSGPAYLTLGLVVSGTHEFIGSASQKIVVGGIDLRPK